jgi:acyl transferase domain-containing protein
VSHAQQRRPEDETSPRVLVLSAKNGKSLQKAVEHLREYTAKTPCPVNDLVYTLGSRREHLAHRAFAIIDPDGTMSDFEKSRDVPSGITFVFTGQGAQWAGMGKELISASPCFRSSIRAMDKELSLLMNPPSWTLEGRPPCICANTQPDLTILMIQKSLGKMKNQAGFRSLNLLSRSPRQYRSHW